MSIMYAKSDFRYVNVFFLGINDLVPVTFYWRLRTQRLQCPAPKRCLKYGGKLLVIELVLSGIWTKFLVNLTGRYN